MLLDTAEPLTFIFITMVPWIFWSYLATVLLQKFWALQGDTANAAILFWSCYFNFIAIAILAIELLKYSFYLALSITIIGGLGVITHLITYFSKRKEIAAYRKECPLPKRQFWLQDLLISAITFGLMMAIVTSTAPHSGYEFDQFIVNSLSISCCISLGSWVASDIFRRSERLQRPIPRGCYQVAILLGFILLPIAIVAWRTWISTLGNFEDIKRRNRYQENRTRVKTIDV